MIFFPKLKRSCCAFTLVTAAFALTAAAPFANASYIVTIEPDGNGNVILSGSGSLNISALTYEGTAHDPGIVWADRSGGSMEVGGPTVAGTNEALTGLSGPTTFGTGGIFLANSGSGDVVGIIGDAVLYLPNGYVSGTALSDTATFNNATLASLGLTSGTYTYTWGSGASADSYVLTIGTASSTPEPASIVLIGIPGVLLLLARRRKRA